MSKGKLVEKITAINDLIRSGQGVEAQRELQRLAATKIPRERVETLAALARRAYLPEIGIKLLNPIVRPTRNATSTASENERIEYAACLIRVDAVEEALALLNGIGGKNAEISLFQAMALICRWDYEKAIPLLQAYIESSSVEEYPRLVAKVNLVASFIYERRHQEASHLLDELLAVTSEKKLHLLYGNSLHLSAMNEIFQRNWGLARSLLSIAHKTLSKHKTIEEFFIRKWEVILNLFESNASHSAMALLNGIREEALHRSHWETLRDCDRFEAIVKGDECLVWRLYFGTPFDGFRKWLLLGFDRPLDPPAYYLWQLQERTVSLECLDLSLVIEPKGGAKLAAGQVLHRVLTVLCSDFYRPFKLHALHDRIYPEEFFNPHSSPFRVHRALERFRTWCERSQLPLSVSGAGGLYRLCSDRPFGVRIHQTLLKPAKKKAELFEMLRRGFAGRSFSASEAGSVLNISHRTAQRVLKEGKDRGVVKNVGTGSRIRYRLSQSS